MDTRLEPVSEAGFGQRLRNDIGFGHVSNGVCLDVTVQCCMSLWESLIAVRVGQCLSKVIYTVHVCNQGKQVSCNHGNNCQSAPANITCVGLGRTTHCTCWVQVRLPLKDVSRGCTLDFKPSSQGRCIKTWMRAAPWRIKSKWLDFPAKKLPRSCVMWPAERAP